MSRCSEHNQRVTHFCLHENCLEKQSFGCATCFKRHHIHPGNPNVIQEQQIQQMMDKLIFSTDIKPKCRTMQQSIYNYIAFMKSQISNTFDALNRSVMNRLSSPFVQHSGLLTAYKKMKVHDYKGINKDQFHKLVNFLKQTNQGQSKSVYNELQQKERSFYHQQSQIIVEIVQQINQILLELGRTLNLYEIQFDAGQNYMQKIRDINQTRITDQNKKIHPLNRQAKFRRLKTPRKQQDKYTHQELTYHSKHVQHSKQDQQKQKLDTVKQKLLHCNKFEQRFDFQKPKILYKQNAKDVSTEIKKQVQKIDLNKKKQSPLKRRRKISIDDKHAIEGLKVPILQPYSFNQNEDLTSANRHQEQKVNYNVTNSTLTSETTKLPINSNKVKQQANKIKLENNDSKIVQNALDQVQVSRPRSRTIDQNTSNKQLFENLLNKGINLPQIIIHTILPAPQQQKSFQHGKQVKKKMITIPMNVVPQQEEIASPLLKKKRISQDHKQFLFSLKPADQANHEVLARMPGSHRTHTSSPTHRAVNKAISQVNQEQKQSQKKINDNEVNSLALLLKALPLSSTQAIPLLELALKQAKNNLSAAQYLSYLYLEQGKPSQCLNLCNKILTKIGYSPEFDQMSIHLNNNKAAALNMLGRYSQSINILERCIRLQNNQVFYKNIGDAYFQIGIPQKALLNYEKAVQLNSKYDEAFFNMAVCLYTQQHYLNSHQAILKATTLTQANNNQYNELLKIIELKIKQAL